MLQLQKYTWLIDTIRKAGKISLEEISDRWERNKDLSDYKPLSRATFNRWKDAIFSQFGIIISCQRSGGYLYYIENPLVCRKQPYQREPFTERPDSCQQDSVCP